MRQLYILMGFFLSYQPILMAQGNLSMKYEAVLELNWQEDNTIVEGRFLNLTNKKEQLTYQLKLQRKSKNGNNISTQQSGSFEIKPQSQQILALTKFNVSELDLYRIYFKVYRKGKLIAEDAVVNWPDAVVNIQKRDQVGEVDPKNPDLNNGNVNPNRPKIRIADQNHIDPQTLSRESSHKDRLAAARLRAEKQIAKAKAQTLPKKDIITPSSPSPTKVTPTKKEVTKSKNLDKYTPHTPSPSPNRSLDLEIDGLIIDETRTKIGRDYYELFYNQWEAPAGAKNFTIKIKELPSRGRGAQIQVFVNEEKLIHRSLQPRQEMIEDLASRSVSALANWLVQNAQKEKDIKNEGLY